MQFDFDLVLKYLPLLLQGAMTTLIICGLASVLAMGLGLLAALGLLSRWAVLRAACRIYVEVVRGTPILILLFLMYYGGPSIGLTFSAEVVGVGGLGIYAGGYFAEIFRSGFQSIPHGQIEAARMLGIGRAMVILRIRIPQMLMLIVPPLTNQLVLLVKESAVLSIITVAELTKNTTQMVNETFATMEPYLTAAAIYWILIEGIAAAGAWVEKKVKH
ncbi:amino acid ABC transporter permease [Leisingera sp. S132]|uniref:amino acid ABC transporter permease n=1 Tax=Leisingera sp. S132 TaxID=2867016 RepID=UPI0021A5B837|nr:amino acid ABC transporter permease [Leisingera sp. S132]UWQ79076.1 amino acid ABC transporter permease [Leisingera sp. S132]